MTMRITRDNFVPNHVLKRLASRDGVSEEEAKRLLEEACVAYARLQHEHYQLVLKIRAALPTID